MEPKETVSISREIVARFTQLAKQRQTDVAHLIEQALMAYLDSEEKQAAEECNINWLGLGKVEPC
jgi:predicted transcriptional regulator